MKGKKSHANPAINAEVSSVPRKVHSNYSQLNEKDKAVHRFAERCRLLLVEVQERSAILQQYASDLVVMDKDLREAQNQFEAEYDAMKTEMNEQEEEYMHKLATLREQKNQISYALTAATHTTSALVTRLSQFSQEKNELDSKELSLEKNSNEPVPQLALERIDFEIDQEKKKIDDFDKEINELNFVVNSIKEKSLTLIQQLNAEIQEQNKKKKMIKLAIENREQTTQQLKNEINNSQQSFQTLSTDEIRCLGEQSVAQKKITQIKARIEKAEKAHVDLIERLKPFQQNLLVFQKKVQKIQDEEKLYLDALSKRTEFDRGINASIQRAQLRSKEINSQFEIIRSQRKKLNITHFMEEEKLEELMNTEQNIHHEITEIENEIDAFHSEEVAAEEQMKSVAKSFDIYQEETLSFQKKLLEMQEIYNKFKNQINLSKKDQKQLVKQFKSIQNSDLILKNPEIDKEKSQVDALLKGYRIQISYTRDQCQNLTKVIKTEELKNAISNSEYRRMNSGIREYSQITESLDLSSFPSVYESNQDERKKKISILKYAIEDLEKRKKILQEKVTNSQLSVAKKTKQFTKSQNQLNQLKSGSKETKLNEIKENMKLRQAIANNLCNSVSQILETVTNSSQEWKAENYDANQEISELKKWNRIISNLQDKTEEIEIKSHIFA
ncbi:hypothetical protein TRFO_25787 [Tritrichomonas foetus]|uniref:Uncharacterized protein n=1 Tax=Tritrichomonas foetus TaxID=1144522 RepID=A0A1J4K979_9EUKA|nr:hypothetical protein TRFO_25787 [Tritrichomonas foetus]|eukprot:OHT06230.1 hypothetical protein TRFO_25787 [Tritrichomonas foetus]